MSDDENKNAPNVPAAEPSQPNVPDEDGWEAALDAVASPPEPDVGNITAPMPPVAPIPQVAPPAAQLAQGAPPPAAGSAPALHLANQGPMAGPPIAIPRIPDYPKRKPQPLVGPLLSVFGAMLWSFVVAGQFTTSWMSSGPMDERLAAFAVFAATIVTGIFALRRAHAAAPVAPARVVGRAAFAFVGAFVAWFATIFVAAIAGNVASRNHDVLIAFGLIALAVTASILGPRLTSPGPHVAPSHGRRVVQVMMWASFAVVTLVAGAELVANG